MFKDAIGAAGRSRSSVQAIIPARTAPAATIAIRNQVRFGGRADGPSLGRTPGRFQVGLCVGAGNEPIALFGQRFNIKWLRSSVPQSESDLPDAVV
jgi:hypothetical protein